METLKDLRLHLTAVNSADDLSAMAYKMFMEKCQESIAQRGSFKVAISGGHTPVGMFELLGSASPGQIDWSKVHLFWVDERCVSPEAEASNYGQAAHIFIDKIDIPKANVHRVSGEIENYAEAIAAYDAEIRRVFELGQGQLPSFDQIILGMGADGHIGSLFPNSYALFDSEDIVSAVYFLDGNYNRITLTHPVLCAARNLLVLVSGQEKAEILSDVLKSEPDEVKYPVHTLWPILDRVNWIVDSDAGRLL